MNWWQRLRRRKQMDQQLEKELLYHLEQPGAWLGASSPRRLAHDHWHRPSSAQRVRNF